MRARELLSEHIHCLKPTTTGERAIDWMNEWRVSHLPVVKEDAKYMGLVSEDDIYNMADPSERIGDRFTHLPKPFVEAESHIYEVMKLFSDLKITVIPILDEHSAYIGSTDILQVMSQITAVNSISEPGSVVVLLMSKHDYSLSEIARIVEGNHSKILSAFITSRKDSTEIEVTLKINADNIDRIIHTFNRYDYTIKATFQKGNFEEDLKRRYDELMHFLTI